MFNDLLVFIPKKNVLMSISEGTGDNLLDEDYEEGYQDYVNYNVVSVNHAIEGDSLNPGEGGMFMYKDIIQEKFTDLTQVIPDLLEDYFEDRNLEYQVLGRYQWNGNG